MKLDTLLVGVADGIAITLSRPHKRNAMNPRFI